MMLDVPSFAGGLELGRDGIWFSGQRGPVSYPADGNLACQRIEDGSFWFRHRNRCIISLARRFAPGAPFLDIGGGNGFVAQGPIRAGFPCTLVEPGPAGALAARRRGVDQVICARLEDVSFKPSSVAAAGMFDVLEHIEDDLGTLRRVRSVLRSRGRLFMTVPAYKFLFSTDDVVAGHFRRYTLSRLGRVLRSAGYELEHATYLFAPLPPLVLLLRTVPTWLGLRQAMPERQEAEHTPGGFSARVIDAMLNAEARRVAGGGRVPVGTSCLVVARVG